MTVFKGFMRIAKRNAAMLFMYMAIFITVCIMVQAMTKGEGMTDFEEESLNIAVIDRDGGTLARGLTEYLGEKHNLVDIEDDKDVIQEELFYRNIYYVVTIPGDFEESCLRGGEKLKTSKVPGTNSAFYIDQHIDTFLNDVRIYEKSGFTIQEAVDQVMEDGRGETKVTLIDKNGHGGTIAPHAFMYQYMPYVILSVICYVAGFIMITFRKKDIRRRMLCSAVSSRKQNLQLMSGMLALGTGIWLICILLPVIMYGKEFLNDANMVYYIVNAFLFMLVALAIAFVIGVLVEKEEVINGVVNVVALGMCFLCGTFVSLDVMGKGVRTFSQFLPLYWYEKTNNIIASNAAFTASQQAEIMKGFGIQLLFAAAIFGAAMIASRSKEQE